MRNNKGFVPIMKLSFFPVIIRQLSSVAQSYPFFPAIGSKSKASSPFEPSSRKCQDFPASYLERNRWGRVVQFTPPLWKNWTIFFVRNQNKILYRPTSTLESRINLGISVHCCIKCPQILREKTSSQNSQGIAL